MSCAFPNDGGALEDIQGIFMMEKRTQMKFEWAELPAVMADGLLRLHGAGVELAESVLSSGDVGTFRFVMRGGATKHPARFRILPDPLYMSRSTQPVDGATSTCALGGGL